MLASAVLSLRAQGAPEPAAAQHAKVAQEAERRNDFPTAVREYRQVATLFPRNAEVQSNLGIALYFNHDLEGAITAFRKAISLDSSLLPPHLFSGLAWYRLSKPDAAVPELSEAARINPSDVLSHTWLGYAYVAQFRYDLAFKEFQIANQLEPGNIDVWYALGQTYLQIGKDATMQLLAAAPDGARVWQLAGEQAELQGDRQKALQDYQGALKRRPDLLEVRSAVAKLGGAPEAFAKSASGGSSHEDELFRQAHDAEKLAREAFEHVAQIAPDSYRAHQILGDSFSAEGRLEQANAEYRSVLNQKPDLPGIHEAIGRNLLRSGKLAEALTEFKAEMLIQPGSASAHTYAGETLLLLGNDEEARKMLANAQAMDRPPADLYRLLGKLEVRERNYRAAVDNLTHYLSIRKDDANAYYLLSKGYAGLGDRERMSRALASFKRESLDARVRNRAQTELANYTDSREEADARADVTHGPEQ